MAHVFARKAELHYPKQQFTTSTGNMVEYIFFDRGKKETIHFVDGWALRFSCWKRQMRDGNGDGLFKGRNLLFSNNRGHGNSELGDSTEATFLTDCTKDRKELIEHLGLEQIHLVSHSMGALITTEMYEIDRRFDISKIVFVTPAVCNPLRTFPWSNIAKPLLELTDDALVRERTIAGMKLLLNSLTNPITSRIYYAYFKMATSRLEIVFARSLRLTKKGKSLPLP